MIAKVIFSAAFGFILSLAVSIFTLWSVFNSMAPESFEISHYSEEPSTVGVALYVPWELAAVPVAGAIFGALLGFLLTRRKSPTVEG